MTQTHVRERELHREVADRVESRVPGVEVLAVELRGPDDLAVFLDRDGGVDLALCEQVTGVLRDYLTRYSLEVSSPGIERPVRTKAHFERAIGRRVAIRTAEKRKLKGEVLEPGETGVTLAVAGGEEVQVPYEMIVRGNLIDDGVKP